MTSNRDKLERSVSRIPTAAALSAKDRAALVKALESLVGQHSGKVESPKMKKRIKALTEIQGQLKDLNTKFVEERAALKAKQNRCREEGHNFWLYSLKNNEVLAKEITDQDEEALKYLQDIKCSRIGNSRGFKMEFFFYSNPCFENSVLMKTYHMNNDNTPILLCYSYLFHFFFLFFPQFGLTCRTEIKWYPGKNLTDNLHSFFNFFQPVQAADVQSRIHCDYDIFSTIRDEIIPQFPQVMKRNNKGLIGFTSREPVLKNIFLGERAVLEGKYQKLYEPLYKKRYEIVNGTTGTAVDQEGDKAREEKGVPCFWAIAMKNDEVLAQKITKCDEEALKYLKDIKWSRINNSLGFKLEFFFDPNPYFENTVLTKAYHMTSDSQPAVLEKTIGTKINWLPGKSLTASLLKRPRKRSKTAEFMTKHQSFFNFFNTPKYPELNLYAS
uniref:nucleosome assembly protein 1;4-like n=1 Tax=Fragaria vesca subsp. vesca TaxID=101020 RepID=UPI0005C87E81|nr:PREDICTED: nucleosome assembly protein 1;4-like [Fragaria vesca subsp. vesca]